MLAMKNNHISLTLIKFKQLTVCQVLRSGNAMPARFAKLRKILS